MERNYITAVTELLLQGKDVNTVLQNLKSVLHEHGHQSIYKQILKGVEKELLKRKNDTVPMVIVANEAHVSSLKEAIEASLQTLGGELKDAALMTDSSLIGGYIALYNKRSINNSYKEKLVALYKAITK